MKLKYLLLTCLTVSGLQVMAAEEQTSVDWNPFFAPLERLEPVAAPVEVVAEPGQRLSSVFAGSALLPEVVVLPDTETPDGTANFSEEPTERQKIIFEHWFKGVADDKAYLDSGLDVWGRYKKFNDKINTRITELEKQESSYAMAPADTEQHKQAHSATPPLIAAGPSPVPLLQLSASASPLLERQGASRALAASAALGPLLTRVPASRNLKPSPVVAPTSTQLDVAAEEANIARIENPKRTWKPWFAMGAGVVAVAAATIVWYFKYFKPAVAA